MTTSPDTYPLDEPVNLTLEQIRDLGGHSLSGAAKKNHDVSPQQDDRKEQLESD